MESLSNTWFGVNLENTPNIVKFVDNISEIKTEWITFMFERAIKNYKYRFYVSQTSKNI